MNNHIDWYKDAILYEVHVRSFCDSNGDGIGDLRGLTQKLDYIASLGVDCVWLLPIYPSPLKDDGYDIADYYNVHPDYGTLDDFKNLVIRAHELGLKVITDLVLNHTSDQHPWFQSSRSSPDSPHRDYYVWSDTENKYSQTRIIFIDTEPSNWTWDPVANQFYWHRFYACQPDLNFDNPEVQKEMFNVMRHWLDMGVDGFRADAVPYLIEREGTNCENLPETHAYLKSLRKLIDKHYPGKILLCEANQWPEDVRPYFGDNDEFHMGFHFPVMPRIYMSLRKEDASSLKWILDKTPEIPEACQWCIFLRNHDELTLEMVTDEERQWMWQEYAPEPRMRLNLGIRRRLTPLLDNFRPKLELAYSLLFTLPGSPIIYYGDEIGMGDNIWLDDRNGVRTPMQWNNSKNAGFSNARSENLYSPVIADSSYSPVTVNVADQLAEPASIYNFIRRLIAIRKNYPVFGRGDFKWLDSANPSIASYIRTYETQKLYVINNLSGNQQHIHLTFDDKYITGLRDLVSGEDYALLSQKSIDIQLEPYEYRWMITLPAET